jgi:golgi phosphoprotein 3
MDAMALTMPEEILLLLLDDETGKPVGLPGPAGDLAVVGAILMELALAGRIDTDLDSLTVVDPRPIGDPVLDGVLARLAEPGAARTSRGWIQDFAKGAGLLRTQLLERLVQAGVLRRVEDRFLWVFPERRYPKAEARVEVEAVRARLRHVLLDDSIPEPRDALLIGLARAASLVPLLVSPDEAVRAAPRVERIAALEELSRSLGAATRDIYAALMRQGAIH